MLPVGTSCMQMDIQLCWMTADLLKIDLELLQIMIKMGNDDFKDGLNFNNISSVYDNPMHLSYLIITVTLFK